MERKIAQEDSGPKVKDVEIRVRADKELYQQTEEAVELTKERRLQLWKFTENGGTQTN